MLVTLPSQIHLKIFNLLNRMSSTGLNLCNTQLLCYTLGLGYKSILGVWYSLECEDRGETGIKRAGSTMADTKERGCREI